MNEGMRSNIGYSTRELLFWLSLYAMLLGVMTVVSVPLIQILAAILVLTAFVIIDAISCTDGSAIPALPRYSIVVAHYASAFAVAVGICFALYNVFPEPVAPPKPPLPFFAGVLHIVSGQL